MDTKQEWDALTAAQEHIAALEAERDALREALDVTVAARNHLASQMVKVLQEIGVMTADRKNEAHMLDRIWAYVRNLQKPTDAGE